MGCWNGTCLLSNLPIRAGQRAVAYVIQYNEYGNKTIANSGVCYSHEYAKPISLPIRGEYDDYGGIEGYNGLAAELAASGLQVSVTQVVRELERGNLANQSVVLMLEDVHDGMIKHMYDLMTKPGYYGHSRSITTEDIKEHISHDMSVDRVVEDVKSDPTKEHIAALLNHTRRLIDDLGGMTPPRGPDFGGLIRYIKDNKIENYDAVVEEYVRGANDLTAIQICMEHMRKLWLVPSGSGSQSENYESYLVLADLMRKHIFDSMSEEGPEGVYRRLLNGQDY